MTPRLQEQLDRIQNQIQTASLRPVTEIPAALSNTIALLEEVRHQLSDCPGNGRATAVAQLTAFRAQLALFSSVMRRSEMIFQGYARRAGVTLHEYGPGGASDTTRDPAFFNFSV